MDKDPTANFHRGHINSVEAHESIRESKTALQGRIVALIAREGGMTSDEVERRTGLSHQTVSARLTEAKAAGRLKESGERRPTRSGRNASVLVIAE